ncbi:MAG: cupin domain-containing protein [Planctomycetales bacterium]|nr:cupin domain-containing protein [Planctomycetales bacterium]
MRPDNLIAHPEGGRYQEVFRSLAQIQSATGQVRSALTHIYFSLDAGEVSRFHRVASDEVWNLYQGEGLLLVTWDGSSQRPQEVILSAQAHCFCHVVPAGYWQAAQPLSGARSVLVGCSVAPGFDFSDFELIDPRSEVASRLRGFDDKWSAYIDE